MKIIYKPGDLLVGPERCICHGCNAQKKMRSGVAAIIREKYPKAYDDYVKYAEEVGLKVGNIIVSDNQDRIIINAITQQFYGRDPNTVYVSYDGMRSCIQKINQYAKENGIADVAMPLIGAGLANGSWKVISQIIEDESVDFQPIVYLIDGVIPTS